MPPQSTSEVLHLELLPGLYSVSQLPTGDKLSETLLDRLQQPGVKFTSITRTDEEISIVAEVTGGAEATAEWRCIKIRGPMDFGLTGILNDLSTPLKAARIAIFAVSTWNTDYVLIKREKADEAVRVLSEDGWRFSTR